MTIEEQLAELNNEVRCNLSPSKIHGIGVFAIRDIKKGERCFCFPRQFPNHYAVSFERLRELRPEIKELVLARWPSIINGSMFISPNDMAHLITFMNHSRQPNYAVETDCALRDIVCGEELTEDYRLMKNAEKIYDFL